MKVCFGEVGSTAAKFKPFAQVFSASASAASAQIGIVRDLIFGCLCSESAVWVWHLIGNLNGRSGEIRCTANILPLHLRVNAASAKAKNPRSVLSRNPDFRCVCEGHIVPSSTPSVGYAGWFQRTFPTFAFGHVADAASARRCRRFSVAVRRKSPEAAVQ